MTTGAANAARTRTRKSAAAARPPARQLSGVKVVDLVSAPAGQAHVPDMVEIFRIDGVPYSMDQNQDAQVVLEFLHLVRTRGENYAASYLFEEVMGSEAYKALRSVKGITPAQIGQVMLAVQTVLLGNREMGPKA